MTMENAPDPKRGVVWFLRTLLPWFAPYKRWTFILLACLIIDLLYQALLPICFQHLIDDAIVPRSAGMLVTLLAVLAGSAALATASSFLQDVAYARVASSVVTDMRRRMFGRLQELPLGYFARHPSGDLMSRFSTDIGSVEGTLTYSLATVISSALALPLFAAVLFSLDLWLALATVVGLAASFWIASRLEPRASALNDRLKAEEGRVASVVQENLAAQSVIKGFSLESQARSTMGARLDARLEVGIRTYVMNYLMQRVPNVGVLILQLLVVGGGACLVYWGDMRLGQLVAFQALFVQLAAAVSGLTYAMPGLLDGASSMRRIQQVLDERPEVVDAPGATALPPLERHVSLDDVGFSYDGEHKSLDHVSLRVEAGSYAAFVGASGSGKSTILNLIARFYDPQQGAVRLDERDLRGVTQQSLRAQMGVVFQDSFLFDTSVRSNIRMGRLAASDEEVEQAARMAGIHDFIASLPQGYDTPAGERGARFSGGQRQRLAIARAIVRDPRVLLLDEATSALDPNTEAAVNQTLRELARERTVLSVTHRLAAVEGCDRIFVLEQGRVVEQGAHAELLGLGGVYARLWEKQGGFSISQDGGHGEISVQRLKGFPIFADLAQDLLEELTVLFAVERVPAGRAVIHEGDLGDKFYVVARGRLDVTKRTAAGREERVDVFDDGDCFGEIALLMNQRRSATVRARVPSVCLTLRREPFLRLLERAPHVRAHLEGMVRERLAENAAVETTGG